MAWHEPRPDGPVNTEVDTDDALRVPLIPDAESGSEDEVEPKLDE